jgi:hypothetical protein
MVNPATSDSAVAGMPLSQAGVAAAIASTSRMVGAALGVAVSGTLVAESYARGMDFTRATHTIWWVMTACGAAVLMLGFASNTVERGQARNRLRSCSKNSTDLLSANSCQIANVLAPLAAMCTTLSLYQ